MTTTISPNQKETLNNCHLQSDVDVRTDQKENSNFAYLQNKGSSSTERGFPQIKETSLSQLHCSDPDDILAQIGFVPKVIEIPDDVWQKIIACAQGDKGIDTREKLEIALFLSDCCGYSIDCISCGVDIMKQDHKRSLQTTLDHK